MLKWIREKRAEQSKEAARVKYLEQENDRLYGLLVEQAKRRVELGEELKRSREEYRELCDKAETLAHRTEELAKDLIGAVHGL